LTTIPGGTYSSLDRDPVPDAVELDSQTGLEAFRQAQRELEQHFADTEASGGDDVPRLPPTS
jgi:hypothetical protein